MNIKNNRAYQYIRQLIVKLFNDDIAGKSAAVSFYILTSFFPCILILLVIGTYIIINVEEILIKFLTFFSKDTAMLIKGVIVNFSSGKSLVTISALLAIWTMSNAILTISNSINSFYTISQPRSFFAHRFLAIVYALLLFLSFILSMVLIIFAGVITIILENLSVSSLIITIWQYSRYVIVFTIVTLILAFLYKYASNQNLKLKDVIKGAIFSTVLWLVSSYCFSIYVNNFSKYHFLYGSIAGIVILFTWVYITSFMILLGGEINAYNHERDKTHKKSI